MTRDIVNSFDASDALEPLPSQSVLATSGDVLLVFKDPITGSDVRYLCSRAVLRSTSEYFNVLLHTSKFSEGIAVNEKMRDLIKQYGDCSTIPASKMPTVNVSDVCHLPKASGPSTSTVVGLFFRILHDTNTPWPKSRSDPINLVALLAILADRLAAIRPIRGYLISQKIDTALLRDRKTCTAPQLEIDNRQRLLAGIIFGFHTWVREYSASLIIAGSKRQMITNVESGADDEGNEDALWWKLPNGVEGMYTIGLRFLTVSRLKTITLFIRLQPYCAFGDTANGLIRGIGLSPRVRPRYSELASETLCRYLYQKASMQVGLRFLSRMRLFSAG